MRVIPFAACFFLLLVITLPDESDAVPMSWFVQIAAQLGRKLVYNAYYARCNPNNVPSGMKYRSVVCGMGWTRQQAQVSARAYADFAGDSGCGRYVSHCQIRKLVRGK